MADYMNYLYRPSMRCNSLFTDQRFGEDHHHVSGSCMNPKTKKQCKKEGWNEEKISQKLLQRRKEEGTKKEKEKGKRKIAST